MIYKLFLNESESVLIFISFCLSVCLQDILLKNGHVYNILLNDSFAVCMYILPFLTGRNASIPLDSRTQSSV